MKSLPIRMIFFYASLVAGLFLVLGPLPQPMGASAAVVLLTLVPTFPK